MSTIFEYETSPNSNIFYYAGSSAGQCPNIYSPATVNEKFEAGTWSQQVVIETKWDNDGPKLDWRIKLNGRPNVQINPSTTPSFSTAYNNVKDGSAPSIDSDFAASIEASICQIVNDQKTAITSKLEEFLKKDNVGIAIINEKVAEQVGNLLQVKRTNSAQPIANNPWPTSWQQLGQFVVNGKIKITPNIICSSKEEHPFKVIKSDGEFSACMGAISRIINDNAMISITIQSSPPVVLHDYTDTIDLFNQKYDNPFMQSVYNELVRRDNVRTTCLMALGNPNLSQSEIMRLQRELFQAMQSTRVSDNRGYINYGLSSTGPGAVGINFILPIGDGGILWHKWNAVFYLNPNNFFAELNYWQQYFARAREYQQMVRTFNQAVLQAASINLSNPVGTTDLQLPPSSESVTNPGFPTVPDLLQPPANGAGSGSADGLVLPKINWDAINIDNDVIIFDPPKS